MKQELPESERKKCTMCKGGRKLSGIFNDNGPWGTVSDFKTIDCPKCGGSGKEKSP